MLTSNFQGRLDLAVTVPCVWDDSATTRNHMALVLIVLDHQTGNFSVKGFSRCLSAVLVTVLSTHSGPISNDTAWMVRQTLSATLIRTGHRRPSPSLFCFFLHSNMHEILTTFVKTDSTEHPWPISCKTQDPPARDPILAPTVPEDRSPGPWQWYNRISWIIPPPAWLNPMTPTFHCPHHLTVLVGTTTLTLTSCLLPPSKDPAMLTLDCSLRNHQP